MIGPTHEPYAPPDNHRGWTHLATHHLACVPTPWHIGSILVLILILFLWTLCPHLALSCSTNCICWYRNNNNIDFLVLAAIHPRTRTFVPTDIKIFCPTLRFLFYSFSIISLINYSMLCIWFFLFILNDWLLEKKMGDMLVKHKVKTSLAVEVFYIVDTCQNVNIGLFFFFFWHAP